MKTRMRFSPGIKGSEEGAEMSYDDMEVETPSTPTFNTTVGMTTYETELTPRLRWNRGVLEQWVWCPGAGAGNWLPVPTVDE
jgi:hypothetical protein